MTEPTTHPSPDELSAFTLGQLPPDEAAEVESHISECEPCCETLLGLSSDDTFVALLQEAKQLPTEQTVDQDGVPARTSSCLPDVPAPLAEHLRYDIVELIGKGGMGDVFKARHRMMERTVAIKVINRELTRKAEAVERFHREVKTAAQLAHPNIVTAYDAEQAGDVHFLVMEHVAGVDLAHMVKDRGALPMHEACEYIRQAAIGLQYAHERGMVHRDIKPHNFMVTDDGTVKILDFGLASLAPELPLVDDTVESCSELTAVGAVMGTPDFISPEQADDAHQADIRSDIYSLGTTLYYLLSGRPPFVEGSVTHKLMSHVEIDPEPIQNIQVDVPDELAKVIRRMMAKDPKDRFQSPTEVADALAAFVDHNRSGRLNTGSDPVACEMSPADLHRLLLPLYIVATLSITSVVFFWTDFGYFLPFSDSWLSVLRAGCAFSGGIGVVFLLVVAYGETVGSKKSLQEAACAFLLPLNPFVIVLAPVTLWTLLRINRLAFEPRQTAVTAENSDTNNDTKQRSFVIHHPLAESAISLWRPMTLLMVSLAAFALFAAAVFYIQLGKTTLRFEINDPNVSVVFGDDTIDARTQDDKVFRVEPSTEQKFVVNQNGTEVETDSLTLRRGQRVVLKIDVVEGQIKVTSSDPKTRPHRRPLIRGDALPTANSPDATNSLGMKLKLIPAGEFTMGTADERVDAIEAKSTWFFSGFVPARRRAESPQHRIAISKPFYISQHEVTVGQFREFVEATGYKSTAEKDREGFGWRKGEWQEGPTFSWRNPGFSQTDKHPVCNVSWEDAVAFCRWLSATESKTYRLPSEAEWEYACRAGTKTLFSTGDTADSLRGSANLADMTLQQAQPTVTWAVDWEDGFAATAPVGSFKPNAFGLFDMHGNVWEWCQDVYDNQWYANSPERDPLRSGSGTYVFRGGGFDNWPGFLRSADRYSSHSPILRTNWSGFRVVRDLGPDSKQNGETKSLRPRADATDRKPSD